LVDLLAGLVRLEIYTIVVNFIVAVLTAFGCLIGLSITIIVKSPKCLDYWEETPIYQLYPRSFNDCTDDRDICGDGIGDLPGIIEKLDYFSDLGIGAIWMNPVYESPMDDTGYDISDYRKIHYEYGNETDMENLINEMHKRGIKLMMDFVPNHTSNQNSMFEASIRAQMGDGELEEIEENKDLYLWIDGDRPSGCELETITGILGTNDFPNDACNHCDIDNKCPNNYMSVFSGNLEEIIPAWTYHPKVDKYYYRAFGHFQPDLNLRNEKVLKELNDILEFWMEKGIDGFRVDAIAYGLENEDWRDEPKKDPVKEGFWGNLHHDYTYEFSTFHDIIMGFRQIMDKYSTEPGVDRMMITEATDSQV